MKNIKSLTNFLNEDFDPGTVQVPGDAYVAQVNSRNYQAAHQPLPEVLDSMYESSYFCEFLDECGKSDHFDKFLKESKRSGVDIASHIKENFLAKNTKNKK